MSSKPLRAPTSMPSTSSSACAAATRSARPQSGRDMTVNLWVNEDHALAYLRERDTLPHRVDALEVLCELLPARVERVLDLGTGDGITLGLVLAARPEATGVGLDFGDEMLRRARDRF